LCCNTEFVHHLISNRWHLRVRRMLQRHQMVRETFLPMDISNGITIWGFRFSYSRLLGSSQPFLHIGHGYHDHIQCTRIFSYMFLVYLALTEIAYIYILVDLHPVRKLSFIHTDQFFKLIKLATYSFN
jgi:hypothetical protein